MQKSYVLTATFPSAKTSLERLRVALGILGEFDVSVIEYYSEDRSADKIANMLGKRESIFLSGTMQKQQNLIPCSTDASERKKAVDIIADSMKFARQAGARSVMISSGARPDDEKMDAECLKCFSESVCELHRLAGDVDILLEPGDRDVEHRHLIGHTPVAVDFVRGVRPNVPNISLVFDTSHIAQLGEDLYGSWNIAKDYCTHVHLANCSLVKGSALYGDKHPPFGIEGGVFSHDAMQEFYSSLGSAQSPMTVGLEFITQGPSEENFFLGIAQTTGWFLKKRAAGAG